ncbi:MAG: ABC transporter permease [Clostridia bacterium]
MKVLKLSFAEFFKAIKKQGILGMIAILAVVLTVCGLIYKPKPKDDFRIQIVKDNTAIMLGEFNNNELYKPYYDNLLQESIDRINYYKNNDINQKAMLIARLEEIKDKILTLGQICDSAIFDKTSANQTVLALRTLLVNLNSTFETYFNPSYISTYANSEKKTEMISLVDSAINIIPVTLPETTAQTWYVSTRTAIRNKDLHTKLSSFINSMSVIPVDESELDDILTIIASFNSGWKTEISNQINNFMIENPSNNQFSVKSNLNRLFTNYVTAIKSAVSYANTALLIELSNGKPDIELQNYIGFDTYNSYIQKTEFQKANYYLINKTYSIDVQDTVPFNYSSSFSENAFDFAFFATEICCAVILIFSVFFASGMVAGEQASGTMKMLAIRPFSRRKIILSKIKATMGISVTFIILAFVTALGIGFNLFGVSLNPFLVVFNSTSTILLSPILLSLIYIICATIKIYIFVNFAIFLSVTTRSTTGSVIISFVAYILTLVLNTTLSIYPIYSYLPFASFDLFKFFGGGSIATGLSSGNLISIFSSPVLNNSNFYISITVSLGIALIFKLFSIASFKRRDIA